MTFLERTMLWLRAIRAHQWTKNLFIPAAWFFAVNDPAQHAMATGWRPILLMLGMFGSFCMVSSAFYLFNDICDREADRLHPVKRNRPIASGKIAVSSAAKVSAVLLVLGFVPSVVMFVRHLDRWPMMAIVLGYCLMQFCYSRYLKRAPYVDIITISAGFVMRAIAGTTVLDVRLSPWLLGCTFLLSMFLALCKRRHEKLVSEESRAALTGYKMEMLDMLVASFAMITLAFYVAYTLWPDTIERYQCEEGLAITAIPVAAGLIRYLYLTYTRADVGRPDKVLLTDVYLWLALLAYVAATVAALV